VNSKATLTPHLAQYQTPESILAATADLGKLQLSRDFDARAPRFSRAC